MCDRIDTGVAIAVTRLSLCLIISHNWGMILFQRQVKYVRVEIMCLLFSLLVGCLTYTVFCNKTRETGEGRAKEGKKLH